MACFVCRWLIFSLVSTLFIGAECAGKTASTRNAKHGEKSQEGCLSIIGHWFGCLLPSVDVVETRKRPSSGHISTPGTSVYRSKPSSVVPPRNHALSTTTDRRPRVSERPLPHGVPSPQADEKPVTSDLRPSKPPGTVEKPVALYQHPSGPTLMNTGEKPVASDQNPNEHGDGHQHPPHADENYDEHRKEQTLVLELGKVNQLDEVLDPNVLNLQAGGQRELPVAKLNWLASISNSHPHDDKYSCLGSVIRFGGIKRPTTILTSAHCAAKVKAWIKAKSNPQALVIGQKEPLYIGGAVAHSNYVSDDNAYNFGIIWTKVHAQRQPSISFLKPQLSLQAMIHDPLEGEEATTTKGQKVFVAKNNGGRAVEITGHIVDCTSGDPVSDEAKWRNASHFCVSEENPSVESVDLERGGLPCYVIKNGTDYYILGISSHFDSTLSVSVYTNVNYYRKQIEELITNNALAKLAPKGGKQRSTQS